jgi:K+-transporting ATPase A subunit
MTSASLLQVAVYLLVFVALVKPLGAYMAAGLRGRADALHRSSGPSSA